MRIDPEKKVVMTQAASSVIVIMLMGLAIGAGFNSRTPIVAMPMIFGGVAFGLIGILLIAGRGRWPR